MDTADTFATSMEMPSGSSPISVDSAAARNAARMSNFHDSAMPSGDDFAAAAERLGGRHSASTSQLQVLEHPLMLSSTGSSVSATPVNGGLMSLPRGLPQVFSCDSLASSQQFGGAADSYAVPTAPLGAMDVPSIFAAGNARKTALMTMGGSSEGPGVVVPNAVFFAGQREANSSAAMSELRVTAFLCVAAELPRPAIVTDDDLEHGRAVFKHIPLHDTMECQLAPHVAAAVEFIAAMRAQGRRVLIYCRQGRSRSASVAAAYLRTETGCSFDAALEFLRQRRSAEPNPGFCMQLDAMAVAPQQRERLMSATDSYLIDCPDASVNSAYGNPVLASAPSSPLPWAAHERRPSYFAAAAQWSAPATRDVSPSLSPRAESAMPMIRRRRASGATF
jgi:predicted protein tyrosine phosphatase